MCLTALPLLPPPAPPSLFPQAGISPWKQGLHLVSWGTASLRPPQELDATVCIPGDALAALGLATLAEGAGLPLHIGGTPSEPRVEVARWVAREGVGGSYVRLCVRVYIPVCVYTFLWVFCGVG
jgi:hypothetical protein